MKISLSICIIAKNAEETIENTLLSLTDLATEIIVLDTGSTDKTVEISKKYAKVYFFEWSNDFSLARNKCMSYSTSEWIMFIDSDEILSEKSVSKIRSFLADKKKKNDFIVYNFRIINHPKEKIINQVYRNTLFRKNAEIYFKGFIGEYLYSEKNLEVINTDFSIIHKKLDKEELNDKCNKYIKLINEKLNEEENILSICSYLLELGDNYLLIDDFVQADIAYKNCYFKTKEIKREISRSFFESILTRIINNLVFKLEDYKQSLLYINELKEISKNFYNIPEFIKTSDENTNMFILGNYAYQLFYKDKNFFYAKDIYEFITLFFQNKANTNEMKAYLFSLYFELARLYLLTGNNEKGLNLFYSLLKIQKDSKEIFLYIINYYLKNNDINSVKNILENNKIKEINDLKKYLRNQDLSDLKKILNILMKKSNYFEEEI